MGAGAVWIIIFLATRMVSIASIAAALVFPVATAFAFRQKPGEAAAPTVVLAVLVAGLIVLRHRSNIRRLLAGKESHF